MGKIKIDLVTLINEINIKTITKIKSKKYINIQEIFYSSISSL